AVRIYSNVGVLGRWPTSNRAVLQAAQFFHANEPMRHEAQRLLCSWDLGLSGIHIQEIEVADSLQPEQKQKRWIPFGHHKSHDREFALPFHLESSGTKSAFALLSLLLPTFQSGGLAVMDEFENDLHPHMINRHSGTCSRRP
ncbi:abortive infection protein, partial [mine drainage metagenome]